jgi:hypothetical protein
MEQIQSQNEITTAVEPQLEVVYDMDEGIPDVNEILLDDILYPIRKLSSNAYIDANNDPDIRKQNYEKCLHLFHESLNDRARKSMFQDHGEIEHVTPIKVTILDNLALVKAHVTIVTCRADDIPIYYILLRNSDTDEFQFYRISTHDVIHPKFLYTLAIRIDSNAYSAECEVELAIAE